ncbi:hypothetical protein Tco_1037410 [Tanacetum coccineum]
MAKRILDEAHTEQSLVEPKTDSDVKFKPSKEILNELRNNAYSGRVEEDVVDHIAKILEILDLIKMANVDPFQLRMKVFHLSLIGDARKWWMNEGRWNKINSLGSRTSEEIFRVDETTKHALLHSCIEVGKNEGTINDIISSDDEWEESDYGKPLNTNDDSFL